MKTKMVNTQSMVKTIIIGSVLSGLVLAGGCRKKVPYEVHETQEAVREERSSASENHEKSFCYVVEDYHENPVNEKAVTQISMLKYQMAVVNLHGLTPGKQYTAEFFCYDAAGHGVNSEAKPCAFTPTQTSWFAWSWVKPDYKIHKAGKWKWIIKIAGQREFKTEVGVLPPTPDELADLARYEKARENAFRAFAQYWLGLDGTFHTTIAYRRPPSSQMGRDDFSRAVADLDFDGPARPNNARNASLESVAYLQVAGMEWGMTKGVLTEADKLNGVTYRANMRFAFRVFRYYRPEGWTDWEDCQRFPYAFSTFFGNIFGVVPEELDQKLNLNFTIMERDGNWFISTPSGDDFANGKLISANSQWKNIVPLPAYARDLVTGAKSFTRETYRNMGQAARNDPATVEQSAIGTMTMLRGKDLIR